MLLKVRVNRGWKIWSDIEGVNVYDVTDVAREKPGAGNFIYFLTPLEEGGIRVYRQILCIFKDQSSFSIFFDTVAYLCNDAGKTIEKFTAVMPD